ncbi:hypothetical protein [Clostridium sp. Marseille-QA1073]
MKDIFGEFNPTLFEYQKERLFKLIRLGYFSSKSAYDLLFEDTQNRENEKLSTLYLNEAMTYMASAQALYLSSSQLVDRPELDDIFSTFDTFKSEFIQCVVTNHAHQWTVTEFNNFKTAVDGFVHID